MNIMVCIKQVPDTETKIKIKSDGSGIETNDIKWIVNPYDEFAIEEALKLRDKLADGSTVTVLTLGPKIRAVESLRTGLAMGADSAVVIDNPESLDSNATAKALAHVLKKEGAGIVFTGKQAIDDDCSQVAQLLAQYLDAPHATVVVKFELTADKTKALVERETEGGSREIIELQLPCVVGAEKGLNAPRYASLPGIMKAKKKEIKEYSFATLDIPASEIKVGYKNFQPPPARPAGRILQGETAAQVAELAKILHLEEKVV